MNRPDSQLEFYAAWAVADEETKDVSHQEALYAAWDEAEEQQEAEYYAAWSAAELMSDAGAKVEDEEGVEPASSKTQKLGRKQVIKKEKKTAKSAKKAKGKAGVTQEENATEKTQSDLAADKATDLYSSWKYMAQPVPGGSDTEPSSGNDDPDTPECEVEVLGMPLQHAEQDDALTALDRMLRTVLEHRSVSGSTAKAVAAPAPWTANPMPPPPKLSSEDAQPAVPTHQPGCTIKAMSPGPVHGQPVPPPPKIAMPVVKCPPPPAPGHQASVIRGKASVRDDGRYYAAGLHYAHIFCCFHKFWVGMAIF